MKKRPLGEEHKLKLGLFSANVSSASACTTVPERWPAEWADIVKLTLMAEDAGIDFMLPVARWKGYPGKTNFEGRSLESLTWASALLALTRTIRVFGTVHVALLHPVFAAKQMATADQIGRGRFGLNIVCGWNADEFEMFGIREQRAHDDRYAYGAEWWRIVQMLWSETRSFDFKGEYFDLRGLIAEPTPFGGTRPTLLNAGSSPAGLAFAVDNSDYVFTTLIDPDHGVRTVAKIAQMREERKKHVELITMSYLVCRPTTREAEDYHRHYAEQNGDWEAIDHWYELQSRHTRGRPPELKDLFRIRFAGGHGGYPIIGSPDDVAEKLMQLHRIGFAGTTLTFVNFLAEFPYFAAEVLPRLERMGLRTPRHAAGHGDPALAGLRT
jgi:alkanesulfonate monooxygenase SsuD/methylene tetrahydromethanopterin reductase-like flavin-dependent oxidoreductase (luciferase family)